MKLINELVKSIHNFVAMDNRRIDCLVKMVISLMIIQTVNLKKIANSMFGNAIVNSNYRRLQRFFSSCRFDYNGLAKLLFNMFNFNQGKHYLILDRTNWQWGKSDINVLFLCIAYKKVSIPIFWLVLNKKGNSSTMERIAVIQRFIKVFGKNNIAGVLGDREFVGKKWFSYLEDGGLSYYFRIKKDADTTNSSGKSISVHWLFMHLSLNEPILIEGKRKIYGHHVYITGMKIEDDYLIVITNKEPPKDDPYEAIKIYSVRWEIESMFGCLKSKGFNFEDTHLIKRERIKKMVAVLALAFCWAHRTGEWRNQNEKIIKIKKHGRPQYNLFRYGLDWINEKLIKRGQQMKKLTRICSGIFNVGSITGSEGANYA